MKFKQLAFLLLVLGVLFLLIGIALPLAALQSNASQGGAIGIIGGASAPTYTFLLSQIVGSGPFCIALFGVALIISGLFLLFLRNAVKSVCTVETAVISFAASATGALAAACVMILLRAPSEVLFVIVVILGIASLAALALLMARYLRLRRLHRSVKGMLIDLGTAIIYFPAFLFLFSLLYNAAI